MSDHTTPYTQQVQQESSFYQREPCHSCTAHAQHSRELVELRARVDVMERNRDELREALREVTRLLGARVGALEKQVKELSSMHIYVPARIPNCQNVDEFLHGPNNAQPPRIVHADPLSLADAEGSVIVPADSPGDGQKKYVAEFPADPPRGDTGTPPAEPPAEAALPSISDLLARCAKLAPGEFRDRGLETVSGQYRFEVLDAIRGWCGAEEPFILSAVLAAIERRGWNFEFSTTYWGQSAGPRRCAWDCEVSPDVDSFKADRYDSPAHAALAAYVAALEANAVVDE